jgi:hypothetical protein
MSANAIAVDDTGPNVQGLTVPKDDSGSKQLQIGGPR